MWLVIVSYPCISDALNGYAYIPFVVLLSIFFLLGLKMVPVTSGKSAEEIQAEYNSRRVHQVNFDSISRYFWKLTESYLIRSKCPDLSLKLK
ncbi:hypothetical protein Plhal710r2_c042g0142421 [Plasmopara halstedii]